MSNETGVSIDSLNAVKAGSTAFEFEYIKPDGSGSGIFFSVIGAQSEEAAAFSAKLINEKRRKQAAREVAKRLNPRNSVEFDSVEDDIHFGQVVAASRLKGWRGITDPFTPEAASRLCTSNNHVASQIMEQSNEMGNFMKL